MKAAELRERIGRMTRPPYRYNENTGRIEGHGINEFLPKDVCELFVGNLAGNATGLLALLDHADALTAMVEANEQLCETVDRGGDVGAMARGLAGLRSALAGVHAVRDGADVLVPVAPEVAAVRAVTPDRVAEALQAGEREREFAEQRQPSRRRRRRARR